MNRTFYLYELVAKGFVCVCVAVWDNIVHPLFVTSVLNACEERELDGMSEGAEAA